MYSNCILIRFSVFFSELIQPKARVSKSINFKFYNTIIVFNSFRHFNFFTFFLFFSSSLRNFVCHCPSFFLSIFHFLNFRLHKVVTRHIMDSNFFLFPSLPSPLFSHFFSILLLLHMKSSYSVYL